VSHANAMLTPKGRLVLARCVVEDGWSLRRAAERFQVPQHRRGGPVGTGSSVKRVWLIAPAGRTARRGAPRSVASGASSTCG